MASVEEYRWNLVKEYDESRGLAYGMFNATPAIRKISIDGEQLIRLENELEIMRTIGEHPNIIKVLAGHYKNQETELHLFLEAAYAGSMTQIIGQSFATVFNKNPQSAIRILNQALTGLEYVHQNGFIHRDIKPENILLVSAPNDPNLFNYTAKIGDFGIAHKIGNSPVIKKNGVNQIAGTFEYMAPEVFLGQEPTIAVDYFALGVVAYELFTGSFVFPGLSREAILKARQDGQTGITIEAAPEFIQNPIRLLTDIDSYQRSRGVKALKELF